LTVNTINQNGNTITGYYVALLQNGQQIGSAFSPATFQLQSGTTYTIIPENYGSYSFACWQDTHSTTAARSVSLTQTTSLVAIYTSTGTLPAACTT